MKVAVIGAGWAGLSAAVSAAERGMAVTLFEAGRVAGGRARGVATTDGFSFWDNGQHLLIGAYSAVWDFLWRIGVDSEAQFERVPMHWHLFDGVKFQAACLPKPLNLLYGLASAKQATWAEKWALCRDLQQLFWWRTQQCRDITVDDFLNKQKVSQKWRDEFWQPIVWGALNTPVESASLRVLANVLWVGAGSDFCIPRKDLGEILVQPALQKLAQLGGRVLMGTRVGRLSCTDNQILVENERFDRVIIAVAPYHLSAMLPEKWATAFQAATSSWQYHAITTVYLRYEKPIQLPVLMTGFAHGTAQWLIDRQRLNGANEVAAVISWSEQYGTLTAAEWVARVQNDVLRVSPNAGRVLASQVITEKRATIAATPHRAIVNQTELNQQGIFLAGDYLNADYPATLEAAILSGRWAANAVSVL